MYKASIAKILKNDYLALLSVIGAIVIPGALIFASLSGVGFTRRMRVVHVDSDVLSMMPILVLVFAVGMFLFYMRVSSINKLFANGALAKGRIVDIWIFKDRGRVEFEYEYAGHKFATGLAIHASKAVKALRKGQEIDVVVDRSQPKRALIRDLFA